MPKQIAIYDSWDPNKDGVTAVAIETNKTPACVYMTFHTGDKIPPMEEDVKILPIDEARRDYDFQKGNLDECVVTEE